jgi:hypothetical protein
MKRYFLILLVLYILLNFLTCKTPPPILEPEIEQEVIPEKEIEVEPIYQVPLVVQPPEMGFASMEIRNIDSNRADIIVMINFDNPNSFVIPSPRITYNYLLNGSSFIRGIIEDNIPLAASSVTPVAFPLIVNYAGLFRSFPAFRSLNEASSLLTLIIEFDNETTNWEINGALPLRR